jgi:hypothetical protein
MTHVPFTHMDMHVMIVLRMNTAFPLLHLTQIIILLMALMIIITHHHHLIVMIIITHHHHLIVMIIILTVQTQITLTHHHLTINKTDNTNKMEKDNNMNNKDKRRDMGFGTM